MCMWSGLFWVPSFLLSLHFLLLLLHPPVSPIVCLSVCPISLFMYAYLLSFVCLFIYVCLTVSKNTCVPFLMSLLSCLYFTTSHRSILLTSLNFFNFIHTHLSTPSFPSPSHSVSLSYQLPSYSLLHLTRIS